MSPPAAPFRSTTSLVAFILYLAMRGLMQHLIMARRFE
jgi:hypothetical protein